MGIDAAISSRLGSESARVVIFKYIDRESGLDRHWDLVLRSMDSAFNGDIAKKDSVARCVGDAVKLYSGVDILANNAGIGSSCSHLLDQDLAAWER